MIVKVKWKFTLTIWISIVFRSTLITIWKFSKSIKTLITFFTFNMSVARTLSIIIARIIYCTLCMAQTIWEYKKLFLKNMKFYVYISSKIKIIFWKIVLQTLAIWESKMFSSTLITLITNNVSFTGTFSTAIITSDT